jgi:membrane protein implicated in regulation of membrane protease activity
METVWIWAAVGLVLLALEMATGTFYILWFGVAALCLAVLTHFSPELTMAYQLVIYAILSLGSLWLWKKYEKKIQVNSRVGQAQGEEIGRTGVMVAACSSKQNGIIRFTQGLMGSREWVAVANMEIAEGEEAKVVAVEGNTLRVEKI